MRTLQRIIELADGVKKGKLASSVLPEGVTPIVRRVGASQATELRALEGRLEAIGSRNRVMQDLFFDEILDRGPAKTESAEQEIPLFTERLQS